MSNFSGSYHSSKLPFSFKISAAYRAISLAYFSKLAVYRPLPQTIIADLTANRSCVPSVASGILDSSDHDTAIRISSNCAFIVPVWVFFNVIVAIFCKASTFIRIIQTI